MVTQPDGTEVTVYQHGDEHFHWMTNEKGEWLKLDENGYYRVTQALSNEEIFVRRMASPKRAAMDAYPLNIAPRGLVILVNFADVAFETEKAEMDSMLTGKNYTRNYSYTYRNKKYNITSQGSARQYFEDASFGQYNPVFDVVGPVTVSKEMSYYGQNNAYGSDKYAERMIEEACKLADTECNVDFSQYDNDEDGYVDFVFVIYAGYGEADGGASNTIWPHAWNLFTAAGRKCEVDGKVVDLYACGNELDFYSEKHTGIGTFCHEFSHVLGLPDYYLTTNNPITQQRLTPGNWSLMGHGNYLNDGNTPPNFSVYDKYFLGWVTPEVLYKNQELTIPADGENYYMMTRNEKHVTAGAYRTDTVYYIENRQLEGWDAYLPGHGMLIWQVIFDEKDWHDNCPNDFVPRYRLISALSTSSPYTTNKAKPEVPFPGSKNITKYTPFAHNGLYNIAETNGVITCEFTTTTDSTAVEDISVPLTGQWYNLLGQLIDPKTYKGVAIHNNKKYLLQ